VNDSAGRRLTRLVSGGQTGVDRAALDAALEQKVPCGGWCPRGRRAEDGRIPDRYPLRELDSEAYADRTLANVVDSDATLIVYFSEISGGTGLTLRHCIGQRRPYLLIDADAVPVGRAIGLVREFVRKRAVATLNVAGPRASGAAEAYAYTFALIRGVLDEETA